jgi:hypothetical protein
LEVPLSTVLTDAGERMASEERAAHSEPNGVASGSTIDPATKVVIPPVASLAVA